MAPVRTLAFSALAFASGCSALADPICQQPQDPNEILFVVGDLEIPSVGPAEVLHRYFDVPESEVNLSGGYCNRGVCFEGFGDAYLLKSTLVVDEVRLIDFSYNVEQKIRCRPIPVHDYAGQSVTLYYRESGNGLVLSE